MNYTELHRHLDASIRPSTLSELISKLNLPYPYDSEAKIKDKFWITRQMKSLIDVLNCFVLFQKVLVTPEILERVAFEAVEDAHGEGIGQIEFRYSPNFTSEYSGLSWETVLESFESGLKKGEIKTGVKTGLICIVSRDYGLDAAHKTIDFAISHKSRFIGVDLAANEADFPTRMFRPAFQKAVDQGINVTIHAGEAAGPESIWEAIDLLGASRIGHANSSIKDPELLKRMAKDKILIESCPTSNWITKTVETFESHPLRKWLEYGIPVAIGTDDPGIFGVTMGEEFNRCRKKLGLTDSEIEVIKRDSRAYSFIS